MRVGSGWFTPKQSSPRGIAFPLLSRSTSVSMSNFAHFLHRALAAIRAIRLLSEPLSLRSRFVTASLPIFENSW
jgi:hypothetical protein